MHDHYRSCEKHTMESLDRYLAVERANPCAPAEFWERYYEKETPRQIKTQFGCKDCLMRKDCDCE